MSSRITFDASINIQPFKREIDNMKSVAESFFGDAKRNAEYFSDLLGGIGSEFNISMPEFPELESLKEAFEGPLDIIKSISENLSPLSHEVSKFADGFISTKDGISDIFNKASETSETLREEFGAFKVNLSESTSVIDSASKTFQFFVSTIDTVGSSFTEIKGQVTGVMGNIKTLTTSIDFAATKSNILTIKTKALTAAKTAFNIVAKTNPVGLIVTAVAGLVVGIVTLIQNWDAVKEAVLGFVDSATEWLGNLWGFIEEGAAKVFGFFGNLWDGVTEGVSNFIDGASERFDNFTGWMGDSIVEPLKEGWSNLWGNVSEGASRLWSGMQETFGPVAGWMKSNVTAVMDGDWAALRENLMSGFENVGNFIKGVFERLPDPIKNVINGLIRFINGMVQRIVSGLNTVIGALNSIGFDLPSWLGGGSFRINIPKINAPQIPMLARGGIVDRPTLALIGERGKEAVMPLENNTGWISDLANSIGAVVGAQLAFNQGAAGSVNYGLDSYNIRLYLDGRKVAEGIMDDFVEVARQRDIKFSPVFA